MKNGFRITEWIDEGERIPCAGHVKLGREWVESEQERIVHGGGTVGIQERVITRQKGTPYEEKVKQVALWRAIGEVKVRGS